jgi:hypothetical protein
VTNFGLEPTWVNGKLIDPRVPLGYTKRGKPIYPIAGGAVYQPTGTGNIHYDQFLTDISLGFPQSMTFVGPSLFPQVVVQKQSNKYYQFGREAWLPEIGDERAPGTEANEIPGFHVSADSYYAQEHALQIAVTDEERENADTPFSPDCTDLITAKIMLSREVKMHAMVTSTSNFASGLSTTLSGTAQWSDYTDGASHPIVDIKTGIRAVNAKVFMDPNTAVIPYQVMQMLEDHPDLIERIKYSERAILTPEIIAALFSFTGNVIVPGIGIGSGQVGAMGNAISVSYLWGKDVLLAYVPPRPGQKMPAFGYEFVWGYNGGAQPMIVDRWREDKRASDLIRVRRRYDLKLVGVEINPASGDFGLSVVGYLIKSAVA